MTPQDSPKGIHKVVRLLTDSGPKTGMGAKSDTERIDQEYCRCRTWILAGLLCDPFRVGPLAA